MGISILHYIHEVDTTIIVSLIIIAIQKDNPTERKIKEMNKFLDYTATYFHTVILYYKYDMIINIHVYTLYLTEY